MCVSVQAQHKYTNNFNGWYMYFGDHKISKKFGVHLEAQLRRANVITKPQQLLLRAGMNYHFSSQVFATVGYCFVETYPYGEFAVTRSFPENRVWEQVQLKTPIGRIEWISRFRLEQRFSNLPILTFDNVYEAGPAIYTNRFRLLNRFSIPFNGSTIQDGAFYVSTYSEFLINFGRNVAYNIFDQHRAYIALGYKIPKLGRLEIGYMNQLVMKSDGIKIENNHTFQLGLSSNIDFMKPTP